MNERKNKRLDVVEVPKSVLNYMHEANLSSAYEAAYLIANREGASSLLGSVHWIAFILRSDVCDARDAIKWANDLLSEEESKWVN